MVGSALTAAQLDATSDIAGSFSYSPAGGAVLSKVGAIKLTVTFTPYNTSQYMSATASVTLTVTAAKKTPEITWEAPSELPAGTTLSVAELDATASVPGKFTYAPAAGTVLSGLGPVRLAATFTPANTTGYDVVSKAVYLDVFMAKPSISWKTPAAVPAGTTLSAAQLDATASVPGTFSYSPGMGTVLTHAGTVTLSTTFTPNNTEAYERVTASVSLTVTGTSIVKPSIASIGASSATTGTPITIVGTNFGASQGTSTVSFGSTPALAAAWANTSITATVPAGLAVGEANVSVTVSGMASNAVAFTVTAPQKTCAQWAVLPIAGGEYNYQQDEWNSGLEQCATVSGVGFTLTTADFDMPNGAPATYPSIYKGCHWGDCTSAASSNLPIQMSNLATANTSVQTTETTGDYDVAYDIWFSQTATTSGQPNGTEVMIWIDHSGFPQPSGSQTDTVTIDGATWEVWTNNNGGWQVVSYVQSPGTSSVNGLDLMPFFNDAVERGSLQNTWYLIDIEMGFEVWTGGEGLGISNFSATAAATATAQ